jgi:hypothetical protein
VRFIWPILRETIVYFWEELFYLLIYNIIVLLTLVPGAIFISISVEGEVSPLFYVPVAVILLSAFPYALFGLFGTVDKIADGKAIKISTFFAEGRQLLKQAFIWWVINVVVVIILITNIVFYVNLETPWSGYVTFFFVGIMLTWLLTQFYALTFYPKLHEPGFKTASRNAMALIAIQPISVVLMGILALAIIVAGVLIRLIGLLIMFSLAASLINMTTHLILKAQQKAQSEANAER